MEGAPAGEGLFNVANGRKEGRKDKVGWEKRIRQLGKTTPLDAEWRMRAVLAGKCRKEGGRKRDAINATDGRNGWDSSTRGGQMPKCQFLILSAIGLFPHCDPHFDCCWPS